MLNRRGFLGLLFGASMAGMARAAGVEKIIPNETKKHPLSNAELLWNAYFPSLKLNEGEVLHFYRCCRGLVHIGYGSNVQENPDLLKNIPILCQGRKLTEAQRQLFIKQCTKKSKQELATYTISKESAIQIAKKHTFKFIELLSQNFVINPQTNISRFFELPLCMQALALDVFYNVGPERFKKFKKFITALKNQDYQTAVLESQVFVNKKGETKKINVGRERRKSRSLDILRLVCKNMNATPNQIKDLVKQDYVAHTPASVRIFQQKYDLPCEQALACGELEYQRTQTQTLFARKQNKNKITQQV